MPMGSLWQDFGRQVAMFTLRTLWMQTGESFGMGLGGCGCSRVDMKRWVWKGLALVTHWQLVQRGCRGNREMRTTEYHSRGRNEHSQCWVISENKNWLFKSCQKQAWASLSTQAPQKGILIQMSVTEISEFLLKERLLWMCQVPCSVLYTHHLT